MQRLLPISDDDVRRMIHLLGTIAGMTESMGERRRALLEGLAQLIDADVYAWYVSRGLQNSRPGPVFVFDDGFINEAQRAAFRRASADPDFGAQLLRQMDFSRHSSIVFDSAQVSDDVAPQMRQWKRLIGLEHLLLSTYPLGDDTISGIGLHRRPNKPPYSPREQAIVHLITSQVDWLHRAGTDVPGNSPALAHLSPRLSQTLMYLLAGEGRKQIAMKMGISPHTVSDYLKALYKHFDVSSRGELQSRFVNQAAG